MARPNLYTEPTKMYSKRVPESLHKIISRYVDDLCKSLRIKENKKL